LSLLSSKIATIKTLPEFALTKMDLPHSVKGSARNMFNDFERAWQCNRGLKFHYAHERGSGNRMVEIHPIYLIANLLDPRCWVDWIYLKLIRKNQE
jgi:hypothetical protein